MESIFSDTFMSFICLLVWLLFVRAILARLRQTWDDQLSLAIGLLFPLTVMAGFYIYQDWTSGEPFTRATPEQLALIFRPALSAFLLIIAIWLNRDVLMRLAHRIWRK